MEILDSKLRNTLSTLNNAEIALGCGDIESALSAIQKSNKIITELIFTDLPKLMYKDIKG